MKTIGQRAKKCEFWRHAGFPGHTLPLNLVENTLGILDGFLKRHLDDLDPFEKKLETLSEIDRKITNDMELAIYHCKGKISVSLKNNILKPPNRSI